jgi:hypothetical protein
LPVDQINGIIRENLKTGSVFPDSLKSVLKAANLPDFLLFPTSIKKNTPAAKNNSPASQVPSFPLFIMRGQAKISPYRSFEVRRRCLEEWSLVNV